MKEKEYQVSWQAVDLIDNLLQEKEYRLCSKTYMLNDFEHSKDAPGQLVAKRADKLSQDYKGHYVYPDDAADIKTHPFFQGICWERLHLSRPPFIPKIDSKEDTKYFDDDEEGPISDVDDASSYSSAQETQPDAHDEDIAAALAMKMDGSYKARACETSEDLVRREAAKRLKLEEQQKLDNADTKDKGQVRKPKEKKRPRDRVLRDKEVGKQVLELRKKGAFIGYTYRRPKGVITDNEETRGRQGMFRRGRIPSLP